MTKKLAALSYKELKIGEFQYWNLYLYERQNPHIGSAYAWLKRPGNNQRFCELSEWEQEELERIGKNHTNALEKLLNVRPFVECIAPLNTRYKGHAYQLLIPRYEGPVTFDGLTFLDASWGEPYGSFMRAKPINRKTLLELQNQMFARFPNP